MSKKLYASKLEKTNLSVYIMKNKFTKTNITFKEGKKNFAFYMVCFIFVSSSYYSYQNLFFSQG